MAETRLAEALWYVGNGNAELRSEELPRRAADQVLVRALYSGISRGTESLVFAGRVPESEYERMRSPHMGGTFPFPVKHGYAFVGRVEEGPAELRGKTVFALHPHQTWAALPKDAVVPVPEAVPPRRAVLAANMETALNAMWDAGVLPGSRVAVIAAGVVGCLIARLCGRVPGTDVTLVDVAADRAPIAEQLEVQFTVPKDAPPDCDVVFHASGKAAGLATALMGAGKEATVVELSWYGAGDVPVPLGGAFHSRRLKIISSQVGEVAPAMRPRWTYRQRLETALALLSDPTLDVLLTDAVPFADLPTAVPAIFAADSRVLCQVVQYPGAE